MPCLPQKPQDYVILHELAHTKNKNHRKKFWAEMDRLLGDGKKLKREMEGYISILAILALRAVYLANTFPRYWQAYQTLIFLFITLSFHVDSHVALNTCLFKEYY
jgi:hypothetical protein